MSLLTLAVTIGLAAVALTSIVRVTPLVDRWMLDGKKPWACDVCMSFWSTLLVAFVYGPHPDVLYAAAPAVAVALVGLRYLGQPSRPPKLPPL